MSRYPVTQSPPGLRIHQSCQYTRNSIFYVPISTRPTSKSQIQVMDECIMRENKCPGSFLPLHHHHHLLIVIQGMEKEIHIIRWYSEERQSFASTKRQCTAMVRLSMFNAYRARGTRVQTTCPNCYKNCLKKCQNCRISLKYLESPWEMHSNKYKHVCYWFNNDSWNSFYNFRNFRKQTQFCSVKPTPVF